MIVRWYFILQLCIYDILWYTRNAVKYIISNENKKKYAWENNIKVIEYVFYKPINSTEMKSLNEKFLINTWHLSKYYVWHHNQIYNSN